VNPAFSEGAPWSRRRWLGLVGFALIVQVLLVFSLSDRSPLVRRQPGRMMQTHYGDPHRASAALIEFQALEDPTLYALPSARGFAGAAWAQATDFPPPPLEWDEGVRWLTNSPGALSHGVYARLTPPSAPNSIPARKPPPRLMEVAVAPLPLASQSTLRIEGALAQRSLLTPLVLPSIAHSNLLTNAVVQLCVTADGEPFSAVLLQSCGLKSADAKALELAVSARFAAQPAAKGEWVEVGGSWGELVFQWHTVAASPGGGRPP
jgi:hypothetical protein